MLGSWINVMVTKNSNERNVDMDDGEAINLETKRFRNLSIN